MSIDNSSVAWNMTANGTEVPYSVSDVNMTQFNVTHNVTSSDSAGVQYAMTVYVYRFIYVIGIIGNTFTAVVWIRSKLKLSPVLYFIALCIADNFVILTHALETQHSVNIHGLCQLVHMLFLAVQIFAILTILGLSVERYIEVCHPMVGQKLVSVHRTKRVIVCLAMLALVLSSMEGYIWSIEPVDGVCVLRKELSTKFLWVYGFSVLILFFFIPLFCVILLNILVIFSLNKARRSSAAYGRCMGKPAKASFNASFLVVSLYLAVSELVYALVHLSYYLGPLETRSWIESSPLTGRWRSYELKSVSLLIADAIALTSYALDLTIFTLSSRTFRKEAMHLMPCRKEHQYQNHYRDSLACNNSIL